MLKACADFNGDLLAGEILNRHCNLYLAEGQLLESERREGASGFARVALTGAI